MVLFKITRSENDNVYLDMEKMTFFENVTDYKKNPTDNFKQDGVLVHFTASEPLFIPGKTTEDIITENYETSRI